MRDPAPAVDLPADASPASASSSPGGVAPPARVSSETRSSAAVAADDDDPSGPDDLAATAPLRAHYAFAGADDPALDDDEWLARALEAARSQGLVAEDRSTEAERMRLDLARVNLDPARRDDDDVHDDDDDDDDWDWDPDPPGVPASGGGSSSESEPALFPISASTPSHHPPARENPSRWAPWTGDRVLLVDNYDSYTYNLFHLIALVDGAPPVVLRNDEVAFEDLLPSLRSKHFTRVVLSPGPGHPARTEDVGICKDILTLETDDVVPVWGVCLGHQLLGHVHGADVTRAPVPTHGRVSVLRHDDGGALGLFRGIPGGPETETPPPEEEPPEDGRGDGCSDASARTRARSRRLEVVRYHSLIVDDASRALPGCLRAIAWTAADGGDGGGAPRGARPEDAERERAGGLIMAMRHVSRPHVGVQFHPESVSTTFGCEMYANFSRIADAFHRRGGAPSEEKTPRPALVPAGADPSAVEATTTSFTRRGITENAGGTTPLGEESTQKGAENAKKKKTKKNASFTSPSLDAASDAPTKLLFTKLPGLLASVPGGAEEVFWHVFGGGCGAAEGIFRSGDCCSEESAFSSRTIASRDAFWLDSADADDSRRRGAKKNDDDDSRQRSRFSFMGARGGGLWRRAVFRLHRGAEEEGFVDSEEGSSTDLRPTFANAADATNGGSPRGGGGGGVSWRAGAPPACAGGRLTVTDAAGHAVSSETGVVFFDWLEARLANRACARVERVASWAEAAKRRAEEGEEGVYSRSRGGAPRVGKSGEDGSSSSEEEEALPFDFWGGFVGYLGYELRAECGASGASAASSPLPDAAFFFADRLLALDHETGDVFCLALCVDARAKLEAELREHAASGGANGEGARVGAAAVSGPGESLGLGGEAGRSETVALGFDPERMDGAARAVAEGVFELAAEEAEEEARRWLAETELALLAMQRGDDEAGGCRGGAEGVGAEGAGAEGAPRARAPLDDDAAARRAARATRLARRAADASRRENENATGGGVSASGDAASRLSGDATFASFAVRRARDSYVADIERSQAAIDAGETYEVCLTNQLYRRGDRHRRGGGDAEGVPRALAPLDPATLYSTLRRTNPAPYAAFLNFGGCAPASDDERRDDAETKTRRELDDACSFEETLRDACSFEETFSSSKKAKPPAAAEALRDVVAVCCSSPERFLRLTRDRSITSENTRGTLDDAASDGAEKKTLSIQSDEKEKDGGGAANFQSSTRTPSSSLFPSVRSLEAKPIKGTAARVLPLGSAADAAAAEALRTNAKDRAENLMIVDLLRNDLGRVSEPGSVAVPGLMRVESYETVHQLVSTVTATRRLDVSPARCVRAAFPGGSMTGAPKRRTMDIIDALERGEPRGPYSGGLGFFSVSGAFDVNVVIRTCAVRPSTDEAWIGAGGAITALSDAADEWDEMKLKASAIVRACEATMKSAVEEESDDEREEAEFPSERGSDGIRL